MSTARPAALAPSLTARVLRGVLLPLAVTWLLGTGVVLAVASYFTGQAFDRAMLDDAYAVSAHVQAGESGVELLLSAREVSTVLFDQSEDVYLSVLRPDGSLIAGQEGLDAPTPAEAGAWRFSDITFKGDAMRAVALRHQPPGHFPRGDRADHARAQRAGGAAAHLFHRTAGRAARDPRRLAVARHPA